MMLIKKQGAGNLDESLSDLTVETSTGKEAEDSTSESAESSPLEASSISEELKADYELSHLDLLWKGSRVLYFDVKEREMQPVRDWEKTRDGQVTRTFAFRS